MTFAYLSVFTNEKLPHEPGVKYRIMLVGQPCWHLMDWRGCNFRRLALPKKMRQTFDREADAKTYLKELEAKHSDRFFSAYALGKGDGAWFDERWMVM